MRSSETLPAAERVSKTFLDWVARNVSRGPMKSYSGLLEARCSGASETYSTAAATPREHLPYSTTPCRGLKGCPTSQRSGT